MNSYVITVTLNGVTRRFRVRETSVRRALARLFVVKPEYDVSDIQLGIKLDGDEDIS